MERKGQNATEKRLAQVRALKARYFEDELSVDEQLQAKDARIALLESEIADLQAQLAKAKRRRDHPRPEQHRPQVVQDDRATLDTEEPRFDFYRD